MKDVIKYELRLRNANSNDGISNDDGMPRGFSSTFSSGCYLNKD